MQSDPTSPELPINEPARLEKLASYQILDTPPEESFDSLTRLASYVCEAPIALLTFIAHERQWFKSKIGIDLGEIPRNSTFCAHLLADGESIIIPDTLKDIRFSKNSLVVSHPHIRFYAGAPLISEDGFALGSLCVLDVVPRDLKQYQLDGLNRLAKQASSLLDQRAYQLRLRRGDLQRKLLEATLRESEEQYRSTFELADVGIGHLDPDGKWLRVNKKYTEITGYSTEEIMRRSLADITHPDDLPRDLQAIQDMLKGTRDSYTAEQRYLHKNGSIIWISLTARLLLDSGQKPKYFVSVIQDITQKKIAQEALEKSEQRIRSMFDNAAVGIVVVDKQRNLVEVNMAFERMLGYKAEELTTYGFKLCLHEEDEPASLQVFEEILNSTKNYAQIEKRYLRKDKQVIWCRETLSLLPDGNNDDARILSIIEDITPRKEAQKRVLEQQAKMASASKMSALGEMAAGIAHEINNPLAIIYGRATQLRELIKEPAINTEVLVQTVERIENTVMRISKIVKSLRSFARDGEKDPFYESSLKTIIDDTIEFCRERFRNHEIELKVDQLPTSFTAECRPVQISQVLLNLLNNAHDAIKTQTEKWIKISAQYDNDYNYLEVTDSGNGIPQDVIEKMFDPFFSTKAPGEGTGLGLSVSKGIVQSHHGDLYIDEQNSNTKFVIKLPKLQPRSSL